MTWLLVTFTKHLFSLTTEYIMLWFNYALCPTAKNRSFRMSFVINIVTQKLYVLDE